MIFKIGGKKRMFSGETVIRLGLIIGLFTLWGQPPAYCLRSDNNNNSEAGIKSDFEEVLKTRRESEERAARRFHEVSSPPVDGSVTVKIRGRSSEENPRGETIAEARVPREEVEQGDIAAVYRKVRSNRNDSSSAPLLESESSGTPSQALQKPSRENSIANVIFSGLLAAALGGWWLNRNYSLSGFIRS